MIDLLNAIQVFMAKFPAKDILFATILTIVCCAKVSIPHLARNVPVIPLPALHMFFAIGWLVTAILTGLGGQYTQVANVISIVIPTTLIWRYIVRRDELIAWIRLVALRKPA